MAFGLSNRKSRDFNVELFKIQWQLQVYLKLTKSFMVKKKHRDGTRINLRSYVMVCVKLPICTDPKWNPLSGTSIDWDDDVDDGSDGDDINDR